MLVVDNKIIVKKTNKLFDKIIDEEKKDYLRLVENSLKKDWDNELDDRWNTV